MEKRYVSTGKGDLMPNRGNRVKERVKMGLLDPDTALASINDGTLAVSERVQHWLKGAGKAAYKKARSRMAGEVEDGTQETVH